VNKQPIVKEFAKLPAMRVKPEHVTGTCTLLAVERINGVKMLKLHAEVVIDLSPFGFDHAKLHSEWLTPADGATGYVQQRVRFEVFLSGSTGDLCSREQGTIDIKYVK
jgi:hypothetical protein